MLLRVYVLFDPLLEVVDVFLAEPFKELHSFHFNGDPFLFERSLLNFKGEYQGAIHFRDATPTADLAIVIFVRLIGLGNHGLSGDIRG
jgi:hypothetical protein